MNKRQVGFNNEHEAVLFLQNSGYNIRETNFYCKSGEIDIIADDEGYLCFIEVKCSIGARDNLGRPTTTAIENKCNFMDYLKTL